MRFHGQKGGFDRPLFARAVIAVTALRAGWRFNQRVKRGWAARSFRDVLSSTAT
jgi:hypothetical protein